MSRRFIFAAAAILLSRPTLTCFAFRSQDSPASPQLPAPQRPAEDPAAAAPQKKTKKVWTNENLGEVSASAVSQVGEAKSGLPAKKSDVKPASSQEIAAYRKQLSGLQTQLANVEKQIADLKSFSKGETSGAAGMQLHKGYSTEPIEGQVRKLEEKKKSLADQIDALFDAARKRGIEPGQLR